MAPRQHLWLLCEEMVRTTALKQIVGMFASDRGLSCSAEEKVEVTPLFEEGKFAHRYLVTGIQCQQVGAIYLEIISGRSSFVDCLVFHQNDRPAEDSEPLYLIEVTKTTDDESRNSGVMQRATKFVLGRYAFPGVPLVMFFDSPAPRRKVTDSNKLGLRLLQTIGVRILGRDALLQLPGMNPFSSLKELEDAKAAMQGPPKSNVPITITKMGGSYYLTGRLSKPHRTGISHDPNMGQLSLIAAAVRALGWRGKIVVAHHQVPQSAIATQGFAQNKFVQVCHRLQIDMDGLTLPSPVYPNGYWHYERNGEKLVTILLHIATLAYTDGLCVFANHAGCEKSYFWDPQIKKRTVAKSVKINGVATRVSLPDLVLRDSKGEEVVSIEGEMTRNLYAKNQGVNQLPGFATFEEQYIVPAYGAGVVLSRSAVGYGTLRPLQQLVSLVLEQDGTIHKGSLLPPLLERVIDGLLEAARLTESAAAANISVP